MSLNESRLKNNFAFVNIFVHIFEYIYREYIYFM